MWNKTLIEMLKELPMDYEVIMYDYMNCGTIASFEVDNENKQILIHGPEKIEF